MSEIELISEFKKCYQEYNNILSSLFAYTDYLNPKQIHNYIIENEYNDFQKTINNLFKSVEGKPKIILELNKLFVFENGKYSFSSLAKTINSLYRKITSAILKIRDVVIYGEEYYNINDVEFNLFNQPDIYSNLKLYYNNTNNSCRIEYIETFEF